MIKITKTHKDGYYRKLIVWDKGFFYSGFAKDFKQEPIKVIELEERK